MLVLALVGVGQGLLLRGGGVSDYHGEVALLVALEHELLLDIRCPDCREESLLSLGPAALVSLPDLGTTVLKLGETSFIITQQPFVALFLPAEPLLWLLSPMMQFKSLWATKAFTLINLLVFAGFAWAFARRWLGPEVAFLAALLLATDPFVAVVGRVTPGPFRLPTYMVLAMLLWMGPGRRRAFGAGLVLGLACTSSLMSAWNILGALVFALTTGRWRRPRSEHAAMLGGGLAGVSPIIGYNLLTGGTIAWVRSNLARTDLGFTSLSVENLVTRAGQLVGAFDPALMVEPYFGWDMARNLPGPLLFGLAVALVAHQALAGERRAEARGLLAVLAAIWGVTPFTLSSLAPHHLAVAYPFPHLILAWAAVLGLRSPRVWRSLTGLLVATWFLGALHVDADWSRELTATGGTRLWADTPPRLATALLEEGCTEPIALQPQPYHLVAWLTGGKVRVRNPYGADLHTGDPERQRNALTPRMQPGACFIRKMLPDGPQPRSALGDDPYWPFATELAASLGGRFEVIRWVPEGDPQLGYQVLRFRDRVGQ